MANYTKSDQRKADTLKMLAELQRNANKPAAKCPTCDGALWVCENHQDRPWASRSNRADACSCGAGAPCPTCNTGRPPVWRNA